VRDATETELEDGAKAYELRDLDLYEVSLVQIPANQHAVVTGIKSGRRNSKADADELRQIRALAAQITQAINGLLADEDEQDEPDGGPDPDANAEEPEGAKAEEQTETDADEPDHLEQAKAYAQSILKSLEF
jgi:hypothetical protein